MKFEDFIDVLNLPNEFLSCCDGFHGGSCTIEHVQSTKIHVFVLEAEKLCAAREINNFRFYARTL